MRGLLRWSALVAFSLCVLQPLRADEQKKDDKKPAPTADDKKKDEKKPSPTGEEKKKDDKKPAGDEPKKKPDTKSAAKQSRAPAKAKFTFLRKFSARLGKVDSPPKYGVVIKEPYVNNNKIALRDKEIEIEAAEDMKVRLYYPPPNFDEKGRRKRYTRKDLEDLKGPEKHLPGYMADLDSLKSGQIVNIYLGPKKNGTRADKPVIILIEILADPN